MSFTHDEVRDFLYEEARYLDEKDWTPWLEMYCADAQYWVPSWDDDGKPTSDPQREVSLIYYAKRDGLEDRVFRIRTEKSSASTPDHRTGHNLTNIEILENGEDTCKVRFNWITYTQRYKIIDQYFGTSTYQLVREDGALRIKKKYVLLKSDYIHHVIDVYHL
jgi:benzoate/toluate 1,2-dioxygenase subunit beta